MASSSTPLISDWHPDITYDFTLRVGDLDLSTDLQRVEIRSAVTIPYPHIFLDIFMDAEDILEEQLFGQQPIKLIIRLHGKEPALLETIDFKFDLLYIDTESDYKPSQASSITDQVERTIVRLKTVPSSAYKTMSTMVNGLYFNQTPFNIISDLMQYVPGAELQYDPVGRSTLAIDQLVIPPSTLYQVIKYLDRTYGIFNGPLGLYCSFDNKIRVQNLSTKVKTGQQLTLHMLATDVDNSKVMTTEDATQFYTKEQIIHTYTGNTMFSTLAPSVQYIVKPSNALYASLDIDLESLAKSYGVIERNNPKIYYNSDAIDPTRRIVIEKDQTGYELDTTFINAELSQKLVNMSVVVATIEGNLPTLNLMTVGEHVKIKAQVDSQLKVGGAYILKGSDIQFMKATAWESFARIHLVRTNVASQ